MNANPNKPIEIQDCYGPRPDYLLTGDSLLRDQPLKGNVIAWDYRPPGPCEMKILRIYFAKWARGSKQTRSEFLETTEFCLN
jgi:hypothetical protein